MKEMNLEHFMRMCIDLTAEKNGQAFLEKTLQDARTITHADAGTLYVYENDLLHFSIMHNDTLKTYQGLNGEAVDLPPVPMKEENVCSYAAITKKLVNIPDVYHSSEFDFSGPKKYDAITGYNTQSMLVVPLVDNNDLVIGVIQLINAKDENDNVVPFHVEYEQIILSMCSLAAVSLTNIRYTQDIKNLFNSVVRVLSAAIDERSAYNANHTRNVANYAGQFVDHLNELYEQGKCDYYFSPERKEELLMSAWMHDIGKLVTPLTVMNKPTRLGNSYQHVLNRLDFIKLLNENSFLRGGIEQEQFEANKIEITSAIDLVKDFNGKPSIDTEDMKQIMALADKKFTDTDNSLHYWLESNEVECLSIPRGTLTEGERKIMQDHVVITGKLLSQINFGRQYSHVLEWASSHHELLDGSGYPRGLKGDALSVEVRILAMMDIFEALTAADRPYKKSMTKEKAILILREMADDGKLDIKLINILDEMDMVMAAKTQPTA